MQYRVSFDPVFLLFTEIEVINFWS